MDYLAALVVEAVETVDQRKKELIDQSGDRRTALTSSRT
jgi:hypothetical protein